MSDLKDLYQEMIIDHYKKPRNFCVMENANRSGEGFNPLCGDKVTVQVRLEDGVIKNITFQGSGCAISTASASMMTEALKNKSVEEAEVIFQNFHKLITGTSMNTENPNLGKLQVFEGVSEFPVRVKCASLSWHTVRSALYGEKQVISTE